MPEHPLSVERCGAILKVDSGSAPSDYRDLIRVAFFALSAILILVLSHFSGAPALAPVLLAVSATLFFFRMKDARRITVVDTKSSRLSIRYARTGERFRRTIVDRPLGMCSSFEIVREASAAEPLFFARVQWKDGSRHRITLKKNSPGEARFVAWRLSAATRIPTRDYEESPL
jgi:hypothetical protein